MGSLLKCFTDRCNICMNTLYFGPLLCPFFMPILVFTKNINGAYLGYVMHKRNGCLTKGTRKDHEGFLLFDAADEINTFIFIGECIDVVNYLSQLGDGIAE